MYGIIDAIKSSKLFVCDMDGTIYLGEKPIQGAIEFVKAVRDSGRNIIFFTNNASRANSEYSKKLNRLGFESCDVITAGDVSIKFLHTHRSGKTVYPVCTESFTRDIIESGINVVDSTDADIVLSSFDTELTYDKVRKACDCIRNGAEYFCTHSDFNCPLEKGWLPDSGAIASMITASTGKVPIYFGKPYAPAADMILELTGFARSEVVCIGDRLYTDIALGKNAGMTSILVLTGESKKEDVNNENAPDYIIESVEKLIPFLLENA